jgi:hypothetical protein
MTIRVENEQFDLSNATEDELDQIKNQVLKTLAFKMVKRPNLSASETETHDRHSSIHSKG